MSEITQRKNGEEDWKREIIYIVFARKRAITRTALAVITGAVLIALFWPATYEASSSVLVRGKRAQISPSALDPVELRNPEISEQDVISDMEILRSPELARRVVQSLRKKGSWPAAVEADGMGDVRNFLSQLTVSRVPVSSVIRVSFSAPSPVAAEGALEALLDQYIIYRAEVFNPPGQEKFFEERMEHYRSQLNLMVERLRSQGPETTPGFMDERIKGNLLRLVALQKQLGDLEMELAVSAYLDNENMQTRMDVIRKAIADIERETADIQARRLGAESLFREVELLSHSFETFARRAEEARINDSIARNDLAGDVSILSRASGTAELAFPKRWLTILLGLVVAVISGLSVGFIAEFFDHAVRRPEDIQRTSGLPVIASVSRL